MDTKEVTVGHQLFVLRVKNFKEDNYHVDIEAFAVTGEVYSEKGLEYDPPMKSFARKGARSSMDTTYELDEAQRVIDGYVKWDGCSDLDFFPDRNGNDHFCGKNNAMGLGLLIGEIYEFARELLGSKVSDRELFND